MLRAAAILVPLVGNDGDHRLVLTRRSRELRRQPGDIAFPGGMVEPEDRSERAAALRECQEEIGLDPQTARVLGRLDDRLTVQGFRLCSFVALIPSVAALRAGPEVEEIFEVPLRSLPECESAAVRAGRVGETGPAGGPRVVFHYRHGGRDIWGLTARIIRDFLDIA